MEQNTHSQGQRTESGIPRNRQTRIQFGSPPRVERYSHGYNLRSNNRRQNANMSTQIGNNFRQNARNRRQNAFNRRQNVNHRRQNTNMSTQIENNARKNASRSRQNLNNPRQNAIHRRQNDINIRRSVSNIRQSVSNIRQNVINIRQNLSNIIQHVSSDRHFQHSLRRIFIYGVRPRGLGNSQTRGLTPERIGMFQHFDADESMVGEQCIVCMNDLEIGTKMVRLDCHVDHYLCKVCADCWFEDHKTCPNCRHAFN